MVRTQFQCNHKSKKRLTTISKDTTALKTRAQRSYLARRHPELNHERCRRNDGNGDEHHLAKITTRPTASSHIVRHKQRALERPSARPSHKYT
jgi:hypothetical protein